MLCGMILINLLCSKCHLSYNNFLVYINKLHVFSDLQGLARAVHPVDPEKAKQRHLAKKKEKEQQNQQKP